MRRLIGPFAISRLPFTKNDPRLIPTASTSYAAHAVSDDFENVHQGCGFDDACNYIPSVVVLDDTTLSFQPLIGPKDKRVLRLGNTLAMWQKNR
jgi:hypothetical protein